MDDVSNYFRILFDDQGTFGVAYTVVKQRMFTLPDSGLVQDWKPPSLELRKGEFADYLASDLGCRLCSERLRSILQENASPDDELQWLDIEVSRGSERRVYSILHFPNPPDIVSKEGSIFAGDFVVKPVLLRAAIGNHTVFSYPKAGELMLFVAESVKRAIEAVGCTGIEFSRVPTC